MSKITSRVALSLSSAIALLAIGGAAHAFNNSDTEQSSAADKMSEPDKSSASSGSEGQVPAATIDTNEDGKPDAWDRDANGVPDAWDINGDGKPDTMDNNGDGRPDEDKGSAPTPPAEPAEPPR